MVSGCVKCVLMRAIIFPFGVVTPWISAPASEIADPSDGDAKQEATNSQDTSDASDNTNNGSDITRPQNSFETRLNDRTSASPTSQTKRDTLILRLNSKVTFDDGWKLAMLAQVPVVTESTVTFDPSGSDQVFGLGNSVFQTILAHAIDERWAFGVSARLVRRSAQREMANHAGVGVRYLIPEWGPDSYFVPAVRYAMSFAGDPLALRISEPQIAPTLNIDLPGRWFLTFYPSYDIRINFGAPIAGQTGRLFLPFDALVGVKLTCKSLSKSACPLSRNILSKTSRQRRGSVYRSNNLPIGVALGVGGYYYQQITADGGLGDSVGAFRGRVAAIGPLLSYTFKGGSPGTHPERQVVS